jgi:Major Facilitator Superfamily.
MLPQLVPEDKLMRVNGIKSSLQSIMLLASPALSGVLIAFAPLEYIFFIDVITAAVGVSVLLSIRMPVQQRPEAKAGGYFADLRLGLKYIGGHKFVRAFILFFAAFQFLVVPVALLTPLQVVRSFGGGVWYLTAIEITFSAGMLLGGLVMTVWGGFRNRTHSMVLAGIVLGLMTLALGFVPWFAVYLGIMVLMGLLIPLFNVPATVLLQEKVEPNFMGRVFGVMDMIASLAMPLGILVFGPLADTVKIEWLLVGTGALMTAESLLLRSRTMIEAGRPKATAEEA